MKTYCIGDVHGSLRSLEALLKKIGYDQACDQLWFTGDLVNRGPDTLGVLKLVSQLPRVVSVMGNHEMTLLACYFGIVRTYCTSFQKLLAVPGMEEFIPWLLARPFVHYQPGTEGNWLLVHAGIFPEWTLEQTLRYAKDLRRGLDQCQHDRDKLAIFFEHTHDKKQIPMILWRERCSRRERWRFYCYVFTRIRYCTTVSGQMGIELFCTKRPDKLDGNDPAHAALTPWYEFLQLETMLQVANTRILFGHWAALGKGVHRERAISLDSGCSWGRQLTAYCLEEQRFISVPCQEKAQQ